MPALNEKIDRLRDSIDQVEEKGIDLTRETDHAKSFYNFRERKESYYRSAFEGSLKDLKRAASAAASQGGEQDAALEILSLLKELDKSRSEPSRMRSILDRMEKAASSLKLPEESKGAISIKTPSLPAEVKGDIEADLAEVEKCFNAGLYRSATILCGRVLETALHRKYYDATGFDILEKNPGIGLGNLIAKLRDKDVKLDPAITHQIHLINNVRVFSVHKKQEAFMPSMQQAHAIILYTIDVLEKMWGK